MRENKYVSEFHAHFSKRVHTRTFFIMTIMGHWIVLFLLCLTFICYANDCAPCRCTRTVMNCGGITFLNSLDGPCTRLSIRRRTEIRYVTARHTNVRSINNEQCVMKNLIYIDVRDVQCPINISTRMTRIVTSDCNMVYRFNVKKL